MKNSDVLRVPNDNRADVVQSNSGLAALRTWAASPWRFVASNASHLAVALDLLDPQEKQPDIHVTIRREYHSLQSSYLWLSLELAVGSFAWQLLE